MVAHLAGPATLSVWQSQFYMMRSDIAQPISHQSKVLIDRAPKIWETKFDEAQDVRKDSRDRSTSTKRSLNTTRRKRRPKAGTDRELAHAPTSQPKGATPQSWS
jgi:hypothetical protein